MSGNVVTWPVPANLAVGAGGERTVQVQVHAAAKTLLETRVEEAGGGEQAVAVQTTVVAATQPVSLTKTVSVNPAQPGEQVTYTLTVTNNGTSPLPVVTLSDVKLQEISIQSTDGGTCSGGVCNPGDRITWDLGPLNGGETTTRQVVGTTVGTFSGIPNRELVHNVARVTIDGAEARAAKNLRVTP